MARHRLAGAVAFHPCCQRPDPLDLAAV